MSDREQLLLMGFDPARVEWALKATQNRGLQPAMDHLIDNEGKPIPSDGGASTSKSSGPEVIDIDADEDDEDLRAALKLSKGAEPDVNKEESAEGGEAKSIKCMQCGKTFKNTALVNFHAEKSGHDQFEESTEEVKPLTEEEKKQKLAELREKMAKKRAAKADADAEDNKRNEVIRRKAGKDLSEARDALEKKEAEKDAIRRRQEKIDDAKAKAAVRAQIEADKRERAERARREKEARAGGVNIDGDTSVSSGAKSVAAAAASGGAGASRDYENTRLQIRLGSGGKPYVTTLSSDSTLMNVAEYLAGQTLEVNVETVNFAMHFPRKQFTRSDFSKTLRELGLTPSAVLLAS